MRQCEIYRKQLAASKIDIMSFQKRHEENTERLRQKDRQLVEKDRQIQQLKRMLAQNNDTNSSGNGGRSSGSGLSSFRPPGSSSSAASSSSSSAIHESHHRPFQHYVRKKEEREVSDYRFWIVFIACWASYNRRKLKSFFVNLLLLLLLLLLFRRTTIKHSWPKNVTCWTSLVKRISSCRLDDNDSHCFTDVDLWLYNYLHSITSLDDSVELSILDLRRHCKKVIPLAYTLHSYDAFVFCAIL